MRNLDPEIEGDGDPIRTEQKQPSHVRVVGERFFTRRNPHPGWWKVGRSELLYLA